MTSTRRWFVALAVLSLAVVTTDVLAAGRHSHPRAAQVTTATYNLKLRPPALHRLHAALLRDGVSTDRAVPMRG